MVKCNSKSKWIARIERHYWSRKHAKAFNNWCM